MALRPHLRAPEAVRGRREVCRSRPCRRPCRPKEGRSNLAAGRPLLSSADHPRGAAAGCRCAVARLQMRGREQQVVENFEQRVVENFAPAEGRVQARLAKGEAKGATTCERTIDSLFLNLEYVDPRF